MHDLSIKNRTDTNRKKAHCKSLRGTIGQKQRNYQRSFTPPNERLEQKISQREKERNDAKPSNALFRKKMQKKKKKRMCKAEKNRY